MNDIILLFSINILIFVMTIGFMLLLKHLKNIKVNDLIFFIVAITPVFNIILLVILVYELTIIFLDNRWLK